MQSEHAAVLMFRLEMQENISYSDNARLPIRSFEAGRSGCMPLSVIDTDIKLSLDVLAILSLLVTSPSSSESFVNTIVLGLSKLQTLSY